jgi:hypothetical protein
MAQGFTMISSSWLGPLGLVGILICSGAPARAQQFSADLVRIAASGGAPVPTGKLHVFKDKVRIETPDFPDGFFLVDGAVRSAYFVRPGARVFMDARQSSRLNQLLVPLDLNDPCMQWQDMATLAGGTDRRGPLRCERLREEVIDGRGVVAYRARSSAGKELLGWIDVSLKFPLRIQLEDGTTISVENIHEEPQPATLFEIPSAFRRFDPEALLKRIKQSDVWVEQPTP